MIFCACAGWYEVAHFAHVMFEGTFWLDAALVVIIAHLHWNYYANQEKNCTVQWSSDFLLPLSSQSFWSGQLHLWRWPERLFQIGFSIKNENRIANNLDCDETALIMRSAGLKGDTHCQNLFCLPSEKGCTLKGKIFSVTFYLAFTVSTNARWKTYRPGCGNGRILTDCLPVYRCKHNYIASQLCNYILIMWASHHTWLVGCWQTDRLVVWIGPFRFLFRHT